MYLKVQCDAIRYDTRTASEGVHFEIEIGEPLTLVVFLKNMHALDVM